MLFVMYWELSENISTEQRMQVAQKLMSSGMYPPKGVNVIRWDITPDLWGISVIEAESARDIVSFVAPWRNLLPGVFKMTKIAPAMTIQEVMSLQGELPKQLASI